ncbi:hypothetical protein M9H77_09693 [Catharanthus roseus]|uniref:Uncharacterized protein n=1 Tax=Catharanthus roseus TaxID=4058 RepID=A0ACC0C1A1_CATRO|nr:hypothetical protein M9H77_09693 [Catharanthus roseus]
MGMNRYELPSVASLVEAGECSICLGKIDEGDKVRELRCRHLFHRVCLDRWLGFERMTCPLYRNYLTRPSIAAAVATAKTDKEVLLFMFCAINSNERDRWWIR